MGVHTRKNTPKNAKKQQIEEYEISKKSTKGGPSFYI